MYTAALRKVGGSVMLSIPPALLELLGLEAGNTVGLSLVGGRLVVVPRTAPRYSLDELLARCDPSAPIPSEDAEWLGAPPTGDELL